MQYLINASQQKKLAGVLRLLYNAGANAEYAVP